MSEIQTQKKNQELALDHSSSSKAQMAQKAQKAQKAQRALVTGGGGFLGTATIKALLNEGFEVCSLSRKIYPHLTAMGVKQHQGSVANFELVKKACRDQDYIFHCAAQAGVWGDYQDYYESNVKGTQTLIRAAVLNRVPYFIHTSSPSVVFDGKDHENVDETYPMPKKYLSPYPQTKAMAEVLVKQANSMGIKTMILRPHLIIGPGDPHLIPRVVDRARKGRLLLIGAGSKKVDCVTVENAAHAQVLAARAIGKKSIPGGRSYFVGNDEPLAMSQLLEKICSAAQCSGPRAKIPRSIAFCLAFLMEKVFKVFHLKGEPLLTRFVVQQLSTAHYYDLSAIKKDLDYKPVVSLKDCLRNIQKSYAQKR